MTRPPLVVWLSAAGSWPGAAVAEQPLAAPEHRRVQPQPVLVDQVGARRRHVAVEDRGPRPVDQILRACPAAASRRVFPIAAGPSTIAAAPSPRRAAAQALKLLELTLPLNERRLYRQGTTPIAELPLHDRIL
jgi:hypothetical protein